MASAVREVTTPREDIPSKSPPSLASVVEGLTKASAAFAVFGYLSLRSHLNTLGISNTASLGADRYLAELPEIIGIIFLPILAAAVPLALVSAIAASGSVFWRRRIRSRRSASKPGRWGAAIAAAIETAEAPILVSAAVLLLGWVALTAESSTGTASIGLAVGDLSHSQRPESWPLFFLVLYGCAAAYLVCRLSRKFTARRGALHSKLWLLPMAFIALVALQLPILYGRTLHNSEYLKAQVSLSSGKESAEQGSTCGLLVLATNSDLMLWQVEGATGNIRVIPKSEIKQMITGESADVWELAGKAARKTPVSLCPTANVTQEGAR